MVNITLSIPEELKKIMGEFPEINWSGLVRLSITEKIKQLIWKKNMLQQLESEKEFDEIALEIGGKIKEGMWKRYKKKGW